MTAILRKVEKTFTFEDQRVEVNELAWDVYNLQLGNAKLSDFSVVVNANSGTGNLTYDDTTGEFEYTPPDLSQFLTSYTETDPIFVASVAYNITAQNVTDWNNAHSWGNHALEGYIKGIGSFSIGALSDVDTTTNAPSAKDHLVFDGTNWVPTSPEANVFISDAPPANPDVGDLWYESDKGALKIYYEDADSTQWVDTNVLPISSGAGITLTDLSVITDNPLGGGGLVYDNTSGEFTFTPANVLSLSDFSVTTASPSGGGSLTYLTGTFTYTPPDLSTYLELTDLSVNVASPNGNGTLTYSDTTGVFTYTPPDLSSGTSRYSLPVATTTQLGGVKIDGNSITIDNNGVISASTGTTINALNDIQNVNVPNPTDGHVLKWDLQSQKWIAAADLTATGGTGISLTDLSVNVAAAGTPNLTYNDQTGVFTYTPPLNTGGGSTNVSIGTTAPIGATAGDLWWNSTQGQLKIYYNDGNSSQWVDACGPNGTSPSGGNTSVTVSDTAPTNPSSGDLWWHSIQGQLKIYYDDGNSQHWVDTSGPNGTGGGSATSVTVSDTAPTSPSSGDLWYKSDEGQLKIYYNDGNSSQWVDTGGNSGTGGGGTPGGATVTTNDTAPTSPNDGDLWWKSDEGQLKVYYDDGNSQQWVDTAGGSGVNGINVKDDQGVPGGPWLDLGVATGLNFQGNGVQVNGTGNEKTVIIPGGIQVQNDGTQLTTTCFQLNFTGAGVTASGTDATKTINIPGGGSGSGVNADWNATTGLAEILNKPTIPAAQVKADWNATSGVAEILNKPTIPTAFSGNYNDLTNQPTIPAAQIQSDWNQTSTSALDYIKNKPTISSGGNGIVTANVKDFGALGDDATDDTAAIQAAINSLANGSVGDGGIVYLPPGVYRISAPLTFMSNAYSITLKGSTTHFPVGTFGGSIIRNTGGGDAIEIINSMSITITNLGIDHTSSSAGTAISATSTASKQGITVDQVYILDHSKGIDFIGYANSIIRNTEIRDQPNDANSTHAILLKKGGDARQDQIRLENVIVEGETPAGSGNPHNYSVGLKVEDWTNSIWVKDCAFLRMTNGIEYDQSVGGRVATAGAFHRIENTDVDHCRNNGMYFEGGYAIWVQNCYIGSNGYPSGSVSASGLVTGENFKGTMWINNADCRGNSLYGLAFNVNHTKIHINSCHVGDNGTAQPSSSAGIYALDGANDITIIGGQCGGDNYGHHTNSSNQQNGIKFNGDNHQRIVIHGVDVTCNISTGISWVNTSGNNVNSGTNFIESCPGYSPGQSPFP